MSDMKDKLACRITATKMTKEVNPSFLTFAEKIEIQSLHRSDPIKWSSERLSESFPALDIDIKRIIKSKWIPRTVKEVQSYDNKVIDNWEKFRIGQIALNPDLKKHLQKFTDRQVIAASEDYIKENIIMPPMEFPRPKSTVFSRIITTHLKDEEVKEAKAKLIGKTEFKEEQSDTMEIMKYLEVTQVKDTLKKVPNKPQQISHTGVQTFSQFLENSMSSLEESTTPLGIAVKHVYQVEKEKEARDKLEKRKAEEMMKMEKEESSDVEVYEKPVVPQNFGEGELATSVKQWVKKEEIEYDFPAFIKIPKTKYKKGMTYRVKDCYYDDDGAFLYRVPGMRT